MPFPEDFTWGVSAASYQIEGAACEDGKGLSVWDVFSHRPGAVWSGHTGDVACDHYHRWREDVALMRRLGFGAYRFSISWPRVLPEGTGRVNEKGIGFYDRLVDELLDAGIQPWIVLFHWDYPYELFKRGGWLNPDSPGWFAEYARVVVERLSDRVAHWFTILEPACFIGLGHHTGEHAPGLRLGFGQVLEAGHNTLLAHGKAVRVLRECATQDVSVGLVPAGSRYCPVTDEEQDVEAARELTFRAAEGSVFSYTWWLDPVFFGRYPADGLEIYGEDVPDVAEGDMELISEPIDVCALNCYTSRLARADADGRPEVVPHPPGYPMTSQGDWAIVPRGIYYASRFLYERYGHPIVVTENGHQNNDFIMSDGRVHDPQRVDYIRGHLLQLERAIDDGVPVRGYFHWTIMDNFEWAFGYKVRVGLVYTDFQTLERTPKDSAYYYRKVMETNGACLHEEPGLSPAGINYD